MARPSQSNQAWSLLCYNTSYETSAVENVLALHKRTMQSVSVVQYGNVSTRAITQHVLANMQLAFRLPLCCC